MDEKDIRYLGSLDTEHYTATDDEIARTYRLMLEMEKDHQDRASACGRSKISHKWKSIWKYAVPLAAAFVIGLIVLAVPGLMNNWLIPATNPSENLNLTSLTNPAGTSRPAETANSVAPTVAPSEPLDGVFCKVLLSINPSVEFQLDQDGLVIAVVGLNDDGKALINGIDFTGLSLENAAIIVVNRLIAENYINAAVVEDNIFLSVSGESGQVDVLSVMSSVIQSAAAQYALKLDTVKTEENQLKIVLAAAPDEPGENELPPADVDDLPVSLVLEFDLTGKKAPYSEVNDVFLTLEDGVRYPSSAILPQYDLAGGSVGFTTLWGLQTLIEKGYISDQIGDRRILFSLPGYDDRSLKDTLELTSLILQEADLALTVEQTGPGELSIVPSGLPLPARTAKYTMSEILDVMFVKDRAAVTDRQMRILTMAFSESEREAHLKARYWAVIPNLIGLAEAEAVRLCEQAGFLPEVIRGYNPDYTALDIGKVTYQDCNAGGTWEVGSRFLIFVQAEESEPTALGIQ